MKIKCPVCGSMKRYGHELNFGSGLEGELKGKCNGNGKFLQKHVLPLKTLE